MVDGCRTLIVRHLPLDLDDADCTSLLQHFSASHVRYMGNKGRMKNTAFATFENQEMASAALRRLHQLEILNTKLIVQFSAKNFAKYHPSELEPVKQKPPPATEKPAEEPKGKDAEKNTEKERKRQVTERINSLSSAWNFEYPFNPKLQYMYPAPTITILMNIASALATVPKFYVQVLHLMNKMNLPAPFGLPTCMPPVPDDLPPPLPPDQVAPPQPTEDMEYSSSEESEIESEDEAKKLKVSAKRVHKPSKKKSIKKKLKLQLQMDAQMQAIAGIMPRPSAAAQNPTEVFDQTEHVAPKKIEFKLPTDNISARAFAPNVQPIEIGQASKPDVDVDVSNSGNKSAEKSDSQTTVEIGGFGKIAPEHKPKPVTDNKDNMEFGKQDFISSAELKAGRLSEKEMKNMSVFKKYESGDPTSRLYIKNLTKHVTEGDLHYIYGRYVDWDVEEEKIMYYIQLMKEGRMKGQAFITLPNEEKAKAALEDSNGFMLNGKPMVVQFSRSAKPKDSAATKAKN